MANLRPNMFDKTVSMAGISLVELMITLGIASILLAVATPSFISMVNNARLTTYTNDFVSALMLAKTEAVKRGFRVTVLPRGGVPGVWQQGWDVFVDVNLNQSFDPNTASQCLAGQPCLLRSHDALPGGYTLTSSSSTSSYAGYISYDPTGMATIALQNNAQPDVFTLCDGSHNYLYSRVITINVIGRTNVQAGVGICP